MPRLRWLKTTVQGAFEALWTLGFRIAGLGRHRPATWRSPGGQRILVIAPHPDDEVAGCAGTMLAHRRRGDEVCVCCATDGGSSRALGLAPAEMAVVRRQEIESATRALGVDLEWLGLSEGAWQLDEMATRLLAALRARRPHILYAPSRVDFHPEHLRVAKSLALALREHRTGGSASVSEVRIYPSQVPLTAILTNLVTPVRLDESRLVQALRAHRSQLGSIERCWRHRRYVGALHGVGAAEELWCVDPASYERLHNNPSDDLTAAFRSLRYIAWGDPLAYLRGRAARRRLRDLIDSAEGHHA